MEISIDKLIDKVGSLYKLVVLVSRRAIEIGDGAAKLTDAPNDMKPGNVAIREILEDKITYKLKDKEKEKEE